MPQSPLREKSYAKSCYTGIDDPSKKEWYKWLIIWFLMMNNGNDYKLVLKAVLFWDKDDNWMFFFGCNGDNWLIIKNIWDIR